MMNLEKTHKCLKKTKQKLLLQLQRAKKRKIVEELTNGIEKVTGIFIWADKEISWKKILGVRSKF